MSYFLGGLDNLVSRRLAYRASSAPMPKLKENEEKTNTIIAVVDADEVLRKQIADLFTCSTCIVEEFESSQQLLASSKLNDLNCLILSAKPNYLETRKLIETIKQRNNRSSIIVIGNQEDVRLAVTTIRAGADEFVYRPINSGKIRSLVLQLLSN